MKDYVQLQRSCLKLEAQNIFNNLELENKVRKRDRDKDIIWLCYE